LQLALTLTWAQRGALLSTLRLLGLLIAPKLIGEWRFRQGRFFLVVANTFSQKNTPR
jgi:hypothetical protein